MVPSQMCKLQTPTQPKTIKDAFELWDGTNLDGPFPSQDDVHDFQKQCEMWTHQTTAHFYTLHQSIQFPRYGIMCNLYLYTIFFASSSSYYSNQSYITTNTYIL